MHAIKLAEGRAIDAETSTGWVRIFILKARNGKVTFTVDPLEGEPEITVDGPHKPLTHRSRLRRERRARRAKGLQSGGS